MSSISTVHHSRMVCSFTVAISVSGIISSCSSSSVCIHFWFLVCHPLTLEGNLGWTSRPIKVPDQISRGIWVKSAPESCSVSEALFRSKVNLQTSDSQQRMCLIMLSFCLFSSAMSPNRSWVQRRSTTCWWPPALIRSWRLSERSFTTAC